MKEYDIETIHESLINGQRRQMVNQIEKYGKYDFFEDYKQYLDGLWCAAEAYRYFSDAVISYHRIINR